MAWLMEPLREPERKTFVRLLTKVLTRAAGDPSASKRETGVLSARS